MSKFDSGDIIKKFKELEADINKLWCFVEECCAKIPINIGGGVGLFKRLYRNKWEFKSVLAGSNVTITEQDDTITINSTSTPFTCEDVNECLGISNLGDPDKYLNEQGTWQSINLTGTPLEVLYYDNLGNITSDSNFTRIPSTGETLYASPNAFDDGGFVYLTSLEARLGARNSGSQDVYFWSTAANNGFYWNGVNFILPIADGSNGDVLTTNGSGTLTFQTPSTGLITAIADTNTIDLVDTAGTLTANVRHQDTATINLSDDASGLKADFASMNISQFTNDSGYTTNTGTVTSVSALTLGTTGTDLSSTVANSTTTPVITLNVPTASASNRGALSSTDWSTFNNKIGGSGTTNEIAYFSGSSTLSSLSTATYPSLTELSYVKGVTRSIQDQIGNTLFITSGNQTTTSDTAQDITGLSITLLANTRYRIHGFIRFGVNNTGGTKFAATIPSGSLDIALFGVGSTTTSFTRALLTSSGTLSATTFLNTNSTNGWVFVDGEVSVGVTGGTLQFQFASGTATQTSTINQLGTEIQVISLA